MKGKILKVLQSPITLLLSMALGIIISIYARWLVVYLKPISTIYISLLEMCIIPIVICAVTVNIGTLLGSEDKKLFLKWLLTTVATFLIAVTIAAVMGIICKDFMAPNEETKTILANMQNGDQSAEDKYFTKLNFYGENVLPEKAKQYSVLDFITGFVPSNIFQSLSVGNMLNILFFSILMGVAINHVSKEVGGGAFGVLNGIFKVFCNIIDAILMSFPIAMCAMIAVQFSEEGMTEVVTSLFRLIIVIVGVMVIICIVTFLAIQITMRCSLKSHFNALRRSFFIAIGTGSALATVSVSIEDTIQHLKLKREVVNSVLPIGITMCQTGVAASGVVAAIFASSIYGVSIDRNNLSIILIGAILFSLSVIGVPGLVAVSMLSLILTPLGMPSSLMVLIYLAIIPIINPLVVFAGVYSNYAITALVSKGKKEKHQKAIHTRKIKSKLLGSVVLVLGFVLIAVSASTLFGMGQMKDFTQALNHSLGTSAADSSKNALEKETMENMQLIANANAEIIDQQLTKWLTSAELVADYITKINQNPEQFSHMPVDSSRVKANGEIGIRYAVPEGVLFESVQEEADKLVNAEPILGWVLTSDENVLNAYFGTDTGLSLAYDKEEANGVLYYDARERDWYQSAKAANRSIITDIYDDEFGRGYIITVAAPFYQQDGNFDGVCAYDILLTNITEQILNMKFGEDGYAFLTDSEGELISSSNDDLENEEELIVSYSHLKNANWEYGLVIPLQEVIAPALQIEQNILELTGNGEQTINQTTLSFIIVFALIFVLALIAAALGTSLVAKRITKPIDVLVGGVQQISGGNLEAKIELNTGDEISVLANSFNKMTDELKLHIEGIAKITAEKERLSTELNVATRIQASMLPSIFPAFPNRKEFDIFATMKPAKEVGGDFYDFFMVDEDHLAIVIADVSGKGVPAALFMVIAKTIIKNNAQAGLSPEKILEEANCQLLDNNEESMFVTVFIGVYELSTGKFTYSNAGHNPPLHLSKGRGWNWLDTKPGFVVAGMEGMQFEAQEIILQEGDMLYLYTDGVTEAQNRNGDLYSEPRLLQAINHINYEDRSLEELLKEIKTNMDFFVNGAEQADDITMLVLKRLCR